MKFAESGGQRSFFPVTHGRTSTRSLMLGGRLSDSREEWAAELHRYCTAKFTSEPTSRAGAELLGLWQAAAAMEMRDGCMGPTWRILDTIESRSRLAKGKALGGTTLVVYEMLQLLPWPALEFCHQVFIRQYHNQVHDTGWQCHFIEMVLIPKLPAFSGFDDLRC